MNPSLLESNVWAALTADRREDHRAALTGFNEAPDDRSACSCRMTQNSFLRLVSSKSIFQDEETNHAVETEYR